MIDKEFYDYQEKLAAFVRSLEARIARVERRLKELEKQPEQNKDDR
jgi:hypothetical protein